MTAENAVTLSFAPVSFAATSTVPSNTSVVFGNNSSNQGTVTLTGSSTWAALGYQVGGGIFVAGTGLNANGSAFNANSSDAFYSIVAINGQTLTVSQSLNVASSAQVNIGNTNNQGTVTLTASALAAGANWNNYTVGQGFYIASSTDTNGNGATFNSASTNPYYTISAINGATITLNQSLTAESAVTLGFAPVAITVTSATPVSTAVSISNNGSGNGTITLTAAAVTAGASWSGYAVGQGIFIASATDANGNGAVFNSAGANPDYIITAISGNTITLNKTLTVESNVTLGLAPVITTAALGSVTASIAPVTVSSVALVAPVNTQVNFANSGSSGTITLMAAAVAAGANWNNYSVGEGIYVDSSTDPNGNGTSFAPNGSKGYYTISAISGSTITVTQNLTESGVTVGLAPVDVASDSLVATRSAVVNFGNVGINGTITLTGGGTWAALGYQAGDGIYIAGTGTNGNGATFSSTATNGYYTIGAINGAHDDAQPDVDRRERHPRQYRAGPDHHDRP